MNLMNTSLGSAIVAVAVLFAPALSAQIVVGPNRHVSASNAERAHYEVWAAVDPTNPARMIACSLIGFDPSVTSVVYASSDAGRSWVQTKLSADDMKRAGDPICSFDHNGTAYYVILGEPKLVRKHGTWVYRSSNGGRTWSAPTRLPEIDREYLTADWTPGRYHDRVYVHGISYDNVVPGKAPASAVELYTSKDGGQTFTGPARQAMVSPHWIFAMGNSVVLSDGTVASLFVVRRDTGQHESGAPTGFLQVVTSLDGGASLEPASTVDMWHEEPGMWSEGARLPQLAADASDSPFRDRLYAVWTDFRTGRLEIRLAYSADKGMTWSRSRTINDGRIPMAGGADDPDAMTPIIAVNNAGVLGVAWYDRRESGDNLGWYKRFTASCDGGETWLPSVRVSTQPNAYTGKERWPLEMVVTGSSSPGQPLNVIAGVHGFVYSGGHTGAMAVDANGVFWPFWVDNRSGIAQLWTAPVTVAGAAMRNGSADLAGLSDITSNVTLRPTRTSYDHATNRLTVWVKLQNTSHDTVRAPVKLRVTRLSSNNAMAVTVLGAENGQHGEGAVLDFAAHLPDGALFPDSSSRAKQLVFALEDLRPFRRGQKREFNFNLIDLDVRVLARPSHVKDQAPLLRKAERPGQPGPVAPPCSPATTLWQP